MPAHPVCQCLNLAPAYNVEATRCGMNVGVTQERERCQFSMTMTDGLSRSGVCWVRESLSLSLPQILLLLFVFLPTPLGSLLLDVLKDCMWGGGKGG